jgi:signal transduction histidine kinase
MSDVFGRGAAQHLRQQAVARDAKLFKITAAIAEAVTREQVFEALVDHLHQAVEATSTALWLVHEDGLTARLVRALGYSDAAKLAVGTVALETDPSIPAVDAIRSGEPVWIGSQAELIDRYPHLGRIASPDRRYSVCCLPLAAHGRVLGSLGLTIESGREVDGDEQAFLLLAARYASQALERLRLFEAERRSRSEADAAARRMGVLSNTSRVFVETGLDLGPRLEAIVCELGAILESAVGISLLNGDALLHTCASYHPSPEAHALLKQIGAASPVRIGEGVTGTVASTGKSLLLTQVSSPELLERVAPAYRAFLERHPIYAMICCPLRSHGQVMGTLMATRTKQGETYTPDDVDLIEQLAERAAGAIENSQLYQETVDARRRAEQLYGFAETVVIADTLETVFDAALEAIEAVLGAKRASILTLDAAEVMRFVAWRNLSEEYRRAVEGHSPWAPDVTAPEPILVPDVRNEQTLAAYAPLFEKEGIGALAFIPLVARRRLLGKFMVYYDGRHEFAAHELETARAIASHLASVIARFAAVSRLEETIRGNELFAGVLAHDLLNPLGAIMMGANILLMQSEGEQASTSRNVKPVSRILSSGQRMARMIDQLLDFTRARTGGGIQVQPRASNLGELCAEALGELELAHPEWQIRVETTGDLTGTWDQDRLVQIVSNLVANAGQHGSPGQDIVVRIDGLAAGSVDIQVRNGGTVPVEVLPHLFDPFRTTRIGRDRSRGLGLGLFIVSELVRAHEGAVDVASEAGSTTFRVRLPRHVERRRVR